VTQMEPTAPRAIRDNARESGRAAGCVFAGQSVTFIVRWVWHIQCGAITDCRPQSCATGDSSCVVASTERSRSCNELRVSAAAS
jgi:hypothetical protein